MEENKINDLNIDEDVRLKISSAQLVSRLQSPDRSQPRKLENRKPDL